MIEKWLFILLAFGIQKTFAQYKGGNDDGVTFGMYTRMNISDPVAFSGGTDDGYHFALFNKQSITDVTAFRGGSDDGFTQGSFSRQTFSDPIAFKGGNDDGFSFSVFIRQNINDASAFKGGNDDGFAVAVFNKQNTSDASPFKGGGNDGFAVALYIKNVALPVKLLTFTGQWMNQTAALNWKTATEENTEKFLIQRSLNGSDFFTAGTVAAKGNSSMVTIYSFSDTDVAALNPLQKKFFYRLKSVDKNGSYSYSAIIVLIKSGSGDFNITVYPNPAGPFVNVLLQGTSPNQQLTLSIHDVQGKLVMKKKTVNALEKIDTYQLRSGQYFISVYGKEGLIKTIPLIIQQ